MNLRRVSRQTYWTRSAVFLPPAFLRVLQRKSVCTSSWLGSMPSCRSAYDTYHSGGAKAMISMTRTWRLRSQPLTLGYTLLPKDVPMSTLHRYLGTLFAPRSNNPYMAGVSTVTLIKEFSTHLWMVSSAQQRTTLTSIWSLVPRMIIC